MWFEPSSPGPVRPSGALSVRPSASVPLVVLLLIPLSLVLAACQEAGDGAAGEGETASAAPDSAEIWRDRLMEALGGQEAWESTRFLRFDWVVAGGEDTVARSHTWDRYSGRYRLEFPGGEDGRFLALFDVNEVRRDTALGKVPEGRVWIGDGELSGAARDSALNRAYGIFINDSYWLLMPFKWADPGVSLRWEGRTELEPVEGGPLPTVRLSFEEDLGVTDDRYWGYLDPETHLLAAWQYHLQGRDEKGAVIRWENWQDVGPVRMATDRIWPDGSRNIWFENLTASRTVPEGAFAEPGS